jgi:hypothetical protein
MVIVRFVRRGIRIPLIREIRFLVRDRRTELGIPNASPKCPILLPAEELVHGAADGEEQEERGRRAEVGWKGYSVGRNQLDELGWEAEEGRVSDVPCMDIDILAPSRWIGVE